MSNELFMLSRFIDLYCQPAKVAQSFYDYSYGALSIHITDDGYEYSDDDDDDEMRYPLESVSQLRDLIQMVDSRA